MNAYPDTSFLCAMYVRQDNSAAAAERFNALPEPLPVSSLLLYEFRQSVRFQTWLYSRDKTRGFPRPIANAVLADLQANLDHGALLLASAEWPDVHRRAEELSRRYTAAGGHRSLDVLHVATALHFRAHEFLTFDINQRRLAITAGLRVKL